MKKPKIIILNIVIVLASISPAQATETYIPELATPMSGDEIVFMATEPGINSNFNWLGVQPGHVDLGQTRGTWLNCESTKDPKCDFNNPGKDGIVGNLILPHCESSTQRHCVESLEFAKEDGGFETAEFIKEATGGKTIPADEILNFPGGGGNSLWKSKNAEHAGGFNYVVSVRLGVGLFEQNKSSGFTTNYLNAVVTPYKEISGQYDPKNISGLSNICLYVETNACGMPVDFPSGIKARIKFRVTNNIGGWFQGRLKNPNLEVSEFDAKTNLITVEAEPVTVPRVTNIKKQSALNEKEKYWFENHGSWGTGNGRASGVDAGHAEIFDFIDYLRPIKQDTASGVNSFWSLTTTIWGSGSSCLKDKKKVLGIVTTNAMGYDGNAPSFINGALDYRVTGLHFMPDGKTESIGTYNLVMRSDTARCLYGFTAAPIQATVTIVSGNSATLVGTTTVSEKDGWLKLAAYGFTFSEKTLRVKITQQKNAKLSITCVKGKLSKKITGANPKCPTGYKTKV